MYISVTENYFKRAGPLTCPSCKCDPTVPSEFKMREAEEKILVSLRDLGLGLAEEASLSEDRALLEFGTVVEPSMRRAAKALTP